jgi:hypothetical protein
VIEVTLKGANSLIKELRDLPEGLEDKVILGLSQVAYDSAQKGAGKHFKTGALFQSLYNRKVLGGGRAVGMTQQERRTHSLSSLAPARTLSSQRSARHSDGLGQMGLSLPRA